MVIKSGFLRTCAGFLAAVLVLSLSGCGGSSSGGNTTPGAVAPGAPTAVVAAPGDKQASVNFTAPASDGGSPITGYTVTSNPAGGVDSNAGSTGVNHVVTGLTNGTAYTFTVTATNAVGTSVPSAPSNSVTPNPPAPSAVAPGAPTSVVAAPGDKQASISFTAPASDGGSPITGYTVTSNPAGGVDSNAGSTALAHVVTGLTNGTAYTFTVTATNAVGTGVSSAPSNSVTPNPPAVGGASGPTTAIGSLIADETGGNFTGTWTNTNSAGSPTTATANISTLTTTATANTYAVTSTDKQLAAGVWSNVAATTTPSYDLISTGWVPASTGGDTVADSGDGVHATRTSTNGASLQVAVTKTNLTGAIACLSPTGTAITCPAPGSYPAGAASYSISLMSDMYNLNASSPTNLPATDAMGAALTALPIATFCDNGSVYELIPNPTQGSPNYNVHSALSCSAADIAAAIATAMPYAQVSIGPQATGNTAVPAVLKLSGWTGFMSFLNGLGINLMYAERAGNVWGGTIVGAGYTFTEMNKIATNAELVASGFTPIP